MINHRFARAWNWLAALAILVSAVMPAWSFAAKVNGEASPILEICTASGIRWIDTGTGEIHDKAPAAKHSAQSGHCAWCSLQPLALLPVAPVIAAAGEPSPFFFQYAAAPWPAVQQRLPAQPRAPPASQV